MTDPITQEHPSCPGCGQPLVILKGGITICRTEDGVQHVETTPDLAVFSQDEVIVLDGEKIVNPFGQTPRIKSMFDRAHDFRFANQKREWYGEAQ